MIFLKLILDRFGGYSYKYASNIEMCILGDLLSSDVGCYKSTYKCWIFDENVSGIQGNLTCLGKERNFVYLSSSLPLEEGEEFVEFKIAKEKLIKILDDWEEKVCKFKPREVIIKYENDEFIFETKQ